MNISRTLLATVASVSMLSLAGAASAQNLVTNGGFETGNFAGWTQLGDTSNDGVAGNPMFAKSGTYGAAFGAVGSLSGITQNLTTIANQSYNISFDLANRGIDSDTAYLFTFGNTTLASSPSGTMPFEFTRFSFTATATSALSALTLQFRNDPNFFALDNVSVQAATAAVPEPATWAMMIMGFGMIGFGMRYSMRKSNAKFDLKVKRIAAGLEA